MQQKKQIWRFRMDYTLQITSQKKLEMNKEIREQQQLLIIYFSVLLRVTIFILLVLLRNNNNFIIHFMNFS